MQILKLKLFCSPNSTENDRPKPSAFSAPNQNWPFTVFLNSTLENEKEHKKILRQLIFGYGFSENPEEKRKRILHAPHIAG